MEAYFDNSATTRVFDSVKDIVVKAMTEDYGNPSAKHRKGMEAEQYVRQAAAQVAKTLKVNGPDRHGHGQPPGRKAHHQHPDRARQRVQSSGISGGTGI